MKRWFYGCLKWISDVSDIPARWARRSWMWISGRGDGTSWLNVPESWINGALAIVLWILKAPFDHLDRWLGKRKQQVLVDPRAEERQLQVKLSRERSEEERRKQLGRSWVSRLGRFCLRPFGGVLDFISLYAKTRSVSVFYWGLPVLAVFSLLFLALFRAQLLDTNRVAARYETALADAIRAGNTAQAEQFRIKLEQLGIRTDRGEYRTAIALAESGNLTQAYQRMQLLAPVDTPGFPGAHFWITQNLLDGTLSVPAPERYRLAIQHLQQLRTRVGNQPDLYFYEGLAYYRLGDFPAARNSLLQVTGRMPAAAALLMDIGQRTNDLAGAKVHAIALHRQLQQIGNEGQSLSEDQLRWQAAATQMIGDETLARDAVEQWYRTNPNSSDARLNRGTILLRHVDRWLQRPDSYKTDEISKHLIEAGKLIPIEHFQLVRDRLNLIAAKKLQYPALQELHDKVIEHPETPATIFEHLGALAALREEWESADRLLLRAIKLAPELPNPWNNRAYVFNRAYPKRRMEALEFANRAVEMQPDSPDFRETRGMIFFNLGRWDQAIEDLEIAVNGVMDLDSIHQALAESYRKIGDPQLAEIHERQIRRQR